MSHRPVRTMALLFDRSLEPSAYEARWADGTAPDRQPYGTEHVPDGWVFRPASRSEPRLVRRVGRALEARLGFDLVWAIVNLRALRAADAVYCHTEREYLAAAAVLAPWRRRPLLIGQTIWLFDTWSSQKKWKRALLQRLLHRVDLLVANAGPNLEHAQRLAQTSHHAYLPFGVSHGFDGVTRDVGELDILSVGNDRARDWETFAAAFEKLPGLEIRVASKASVLVGGHDVSRPTDTLAELRALYAEATLLVVSVKENSYASGITALLEAVACRTPVITTRAGGLDKYFDESEVLFVAPGSPDDLARAVQSALADPEGARERAERARRRMDTDGYWISQYWRRVADSAESMLNARDLGGRS